MSDSAEPRAETPFATTPAAAQPDALAGDWSEGLRGPLKASGLVPPRPLASGPAPLAAAVRAELPQPRGDADELRTEQADLNALLALKDQLLAEAPREPEVAAPEGWASADEDQLASSPPPPRAEPGPSAAAPDEGPAPVAAEAPAGSGPEEEVLMAEPLPEDAIVELPAEEAEVDLPAEEAEVDLPAEEAEVDLPAEGAAVDLPAGEPGADVRTEVAWEAPDAAAAPEAAAAAAEAAWGSPGGRPIPAGCWRARRETPAA